MSLADPSLARDVAATLAWWQAAGVDCAFHDDVTALLAEAPLDEAQGAAGPAGPRGAAAAAPAASAPARSAPARAPARDLLGESPPADLAAFRHWWLHDPALGPRSLYPRVPPRGPAGARLMVLVPQPEEGDSAALLEGPQGRLLANMLGAMGLGADEAYLASALPCHMPLADYAALAAQGWDKVLAHHIALVAPRRLLVLGTALGPLLAPQPGASLREFNQASGKAPVMIGDALEAMLAMPRLKARFWRRWMEWSHAA
ncbi:MAG: uracil-DNA glycosylase family protein [Erythrobacter cryptus]